MLRARQNRKRNVNFLTMKRRLVLTNEAARHPFRQRLPLSTTRAIEAVRDDANDLKLFAMSFTAFFVAIYGLVG
jgi:hypothetical protein